MAGLRCGFAIARPDLLAKLEPYGWNSMPVDGGGSSHDQLEAQEPGSRKKENQRGHSKRRFLVARGETDIPSFLPKATVSWWM